MSKAPTDSSAGDRAPAGPARSTWRRFRRSRTGLAGLVLVGMTTLAGLFSPMLASHLPIVCKYDGQWHFPAVVETARRIPLASTVLGPSKPFSLPTFDVAGAIENSDFVIRAPIAYDPVEYSADTLQPQSAKHWLGTDDLGRDVAARLIHGAATSLQVAIVSMAIAAIIGVCLGTWAGYAGGWTDALISRVIEIVVCFPVFFLILSVMVWVDEPGARHVSLVIGLTAWPPIARYTRGEMIRLRESEFALASRAIGASPLRIAFRHLLPNALAPALVAITFGIAQAILIEAGLSWLGFGVQGPTPSWGNMLRAAYDHMLVAPHLVYPPCIAIFLAVLGYNLIGDALRDAIDPRSGTPRPWRRSRTPQTRQSAGTPRQQATA